MNDQRDEREATLWADRPAEARALKHCPDCAEEVQGAANVCRFCGYRFDDGATPQATEPRKPKSTFVAGLLGFLIAGAGHFYVREPLRGCIFLGSAIAAVAGLAIARLSETPGSILGFALVIYSIIDARRGAESYNAGNAPRGFGGGAAAVAILGALVLVLGVMADQTGAAVDTDGLELEIQPELQRQLQNQVPDADVSVDTVDCIASTGHSGHCIAQVSDSLGNTRSISIDFDVDSSGAALWHTSN